MAVYNPADPLNWAAIAQELADQAAGLNPDGSTRYTLPGGMGADPEYIAYLAQYDNNVTQAKADTELRRRRSQDDYLEALRQLEESGLTGAREIDTSALSRGVFQSGETGVRRNELGTRIAQGRDQADVTLANTRGTIDADLEKALTQLTLERERQIVASKARIAEAQRAGAEAAGFLNGTAGTAAAPAPAAPAAVSTATPAPAPAAPAPAPASGGSGYAYTPPPSPRPPTASPPRGAGAGRSSPGVIQPPKPPKPAVPTGTRPRSVPQVVRY